RRSRMSQVTKCLRSRNRAAARHRLALACATALVLSVPALHAQPAPAEQSPASRAAHLDTVSASASRIKQGGFVAPTPTTQITTEEIDATGLTNVADVINSMPSVRPSLTPSSNGNNYNYSGGNFLDLRGL